MGARTEYNRNWAEAHREARRAYNRAWAAANRERRRELDRKSYAANREQRLADCRLRYDPEKNAEQCRRWRQENTAKATALSRAKKARRAQRTPAWADLKKIELVYQEAHLMSVMLGEEWHVDHVIPLRGKLVSGLHVHNNLQILPGIENMRKHNKFEVA